MVIPTLFVTGMDHHGAFDWGALGLTLAQGVAAIVGILLVGHFVLRPLLHLVVKTGSRDLIMAITLLLVVGAAGTTALAGLSSAFGAFLAGLLLSESQYKHQIEIDLEPFKGLLLGLFFMTVGMMLDPFELFAQGFVILAGLVVLFIVKAVGTLSRDADIRGPPVDRGGIVAVAVPGRRIRPRHHWSRAFRRRPERGRRARGARHRGPVDDAHTADRNFGAPIGHLPRTRSSGPARSKPRQRLCRPRHHQRLRTRRPADRPHARERARALRRARYQ